MTDTIPCQCWEDGTHTHDGHCCVVARRCECGDAAVEIQSGLVAEHGGPDRWRALPRKTRSAAITARLVPLRIGGAAQ